MISEPVKTIWDCYQSGWGYRLCALGNIEQKRIQVYWLAEAKLIDGLSGKTEYQKDGLCCRGSLGIMRVWLHAL